MCTVDKMLIKGIRSFSPDNNSVISFFRPLTLIVGPNGAGKTTIIECLKHATTGELPPNARSGHSFIHDPKVAGETETKGQIKLRFKTSAGKDVVCIRSFQLTQKASKLEYKAIESVLQTINPNTGEKVCLSYRCADMDREVPLLMGVSKAILENVIFVHQDEANWPLAEGAVLKKKFDDIFSATRYTKALETLKKVHKEQAQQIKEMRLKLDHLRTLKDAANRLQSSIDTDRERVQRLQEAITALDGRVGEARQRQAQLEQALGALRGMQQALKLKESRREMLVRQRIQQYNDLDVENEDTDEELQKWQENFDAQVATLRLKIGKAERQTGDLRLQLDAMKEQHANDVKLQGRLLAESEVHTEDCRQRDECIHAILQQRMPKGLLWDSGEWDKVRSASAAAAGAKRRLTREEEEAAAAAAGAATKAVLQHVDDVQRSFMKLKSEHREEVARMSVVVDRAAADVLKAEGEMQLSTQRKRDAEAKLQQVRASIQGLSTSAGAVTEADLRVAGEKEKLMKEEVDRVAAALRDRSFDAAIEETRVELYGVEQKMKAVQRERDALAAESGERVTLRLKREALASKEQAQAQLLAEHLPKLEKVLKDRCNPSDPRAMAAEIDRRARSVRATCDTLDGQAKVAGNELAAQTMRADDCRRSLAAKQGEMEEKKRALSAGLLRALNNALVEEDQLDAELSTMKTSANSLKKDHDMLVGMRMCFERFAGIAEEKGCCPVCDRAFTTSEEITKFADKQRQKQVQSGKKLEELNQQFRDFQAKAGMLEALRPTFVEYRMLCDRAVPAAHTALAEAEAAVRKATDMHEDLLVSLAEARAEQESLARVEAVVREIERVWREAQEVRRQVEEQECKLDVLSQSLRTMPDVMADLAALEEKREQRGKKLERLREEQQAMKDEVAACNLRWRNAREDRATLHHRLTRARELDDEARGLEARVQDTAQAIEAAEQSVEPRRREHARAVEARDKRRREMEAEEQRQESELRELQRDADRLKSIVAKIENYSLANKERQLKEVTERMARAAAQQAQVEQQMEELTAAVAADQELLRSQALVKRNIDDNLSYRKTLREEKEAAREVEELQGEMVERGDPEKMTRDVEEAAAEVAECLAEQNRSRGTLHAHEGNMARNRQELRQSQYRDIEARYRNQLIQLKTSEMANKDLDKYYSALDKALMRFHALKMEEINKIVKELWQQTYRGLDIDYIEIRSDAEGAGTRSYSYRVVMRSGDAELDMRGRCSAGQKVLASLIIRLALAETFCLNCGILALDEPTTNLDAPNAESLAAALLRLMEERKGQENFQLIVITHDEKFAQMIGQKQHAERYYRISKDDMQRSRIEVQDIFE